MLRPKNAPDDCDDSLRGGGDSGEEDSLRGGGDYCSPTRDSAVAVTTPGFSAVAPSPRLWRLLRDCGDSAVATTRELLLVPTRDRLRGLRLRHRRLQDHLRGGGDADASQTGDDFSDDTYCTDSSDIDSSEELEIAQSSVDSSDTDLEMPVKKRKIEEIAKNESRFAMDRLDVIFRHFLASSMNNVTLSSMPEESLDVIFRHFRNAYVPTMPMVRTCRKVFLTWRNRRRLLALDTLKSLTEHLTFLDRTAVALGDRQGGVVEVRELFPELAELRDLVK